MGILITSYKSLPEQVEANKEKCEDLQEQIDNIDTTAIEAIRQQVDDNTHDITSLENGLSVTNGLVANHTQRLNDLDTEVDNVTQRLNGLDTAVSEKLDKVTQYANSQIDFTTVSNSLNIRRAEGDTESLSETYSRHATNALTEGYTYSENGTTVHRANVTFDEDGINFNATGADFKLNGDAIITEDNIGTYAPQTHLYRHNLYLIGGGYWNFSITANSATPLTVSDIAKWLYDNGHTSFNLGLDFISYNDRSNWYEIRLYSTDGLTPKGQSTRFILSSNSNATISMSASSISQSTFDTINDVVTQIS